MKAPKNRNDSNRPASQKICSTRFDTTNNLKFKKYLNKSFRKGAFYWLVKSNAEFTCSKYNNQDTRKCH